MAPRLAALLPRLAALTLIWLLATSTITFAAAGEELESAPPATSATPKAPEFLIVPDVRRQAYVFTKGILEDAGFAWRVKGAVRGFAANTVAVQFPAPGVKVVDTGAPTILLRLARNSEYAERGVPENSSPHEGTKLVLAAEAAKTEAPKAEPASKTSEAAKTEAPKAEPASKKNKDSNRPEEPPADDGATAPRQPDFKVAGAPSEPLNELPLPERARLVQKRMAAQTKPTKPLVQYWLYQHAWIVTGAKFGWSGGADALRVLIAMDRGLQARWGFGARSAAVASAALAEVEAKAAE
jgi:hypothetical protein